jgi:hypothetical protein
MEPSRRPEASGSPGAPDRHRPRSPFATVGPAATFALAYCIAIMVWIVLGDRLPGGRWLAVHLFTLGALTNVVVAFSQHFGRTVTRATDERWLWQQIVMNIGAVLVLAGIPTGVRWATAAGATTVTAVVLASYRRLRRMRRQAVGARFGWIARIYERAHGAFIHGATLGLLLGVGALNGAWYGTGRMAHLHVNVLGWGGLTLLGTLVFFGPTVVRARIEDGAEARAATALARGTTGLTLAVLLLASGIGGTAGTGLRLLAATGLGVYAWAVTVVCLPVIRVALAREALRGQASAGVALPVVPGGRMGRRGRRRIWPLASARRAGRRGAHRRAGAGHRHRADLRRAYAARRHQDRPRSHLGPLRTRRDGADHRLQRRRRRGDRGGGRRIRAGGHGGPARNRGVGTAGAGSRRADRDGPVARAAR